MIKTVKINTALLLCTAFIIRILFVNIGIISSLNTQENNVIIKAHYSTIMKRRKLFDALNNSKNCDYSTIEICEEDFDDHNEFKPSLFFVKQFLYSMVAIKKESNLQKTLFYKYFLYTSPSRFLVFRI